MDSTPINSNAGNVVPIDAKGTQQLPTPPAVEGNLAGIPVVIEPVPSSTSATARNSAAQRVMRSIRISQYTPSLDLPNPTASMMRYTQPMREAEENNTNLTPFTKTVSEIKETQHRVSPSSAFHNNDSTVRGSLEDWSGHSLSPVVRTETVIASRENGDTISFNMFSGIANNTNIDDYALLVPVQNANGMTIHYRAPSAALPSENEISQNNIIVNSFIQAIGPNNRYYFSAEQEKAARTNGLTRSMLGTVFGKIENSAAHSATQHSQYTLSSSSGASAASEIETEDGTDAITLFKPNSTHQDPTETQISRIERRFNFIIDETKRRITQLPSTLHASAWAAAYPELRNLAEAALGVVENITNADERTFRIVNRATSLALTVTSIASKASTLANPEASESAKIFSRTIKSDIFILLNPIFNPTQRNIRHAVTLANKALTTANNAMRSIDSNREFNRITELTRLSSIATVANRQENTDSASAAALDVAANHLGAKNVLFSRPLASAAIFLEQAASTEDSQENSNSDISDDSWMEKIGK